MSDTLTTSQSKVNLTSLPLDVLSKIACNLPDEDVRSLTSICIKLNNIALKGVVNPHTIDELCRKDELSTS